MAMTWQDVLPLIRDYQAAVAAAAAAFRAHLDLDHPMHWREHGMSKSGLFGPGNRYTYAFHGPGCTFSDRGQEVDFDFGANGRMDGFDAVRLWHFADERPRQYRAFVDRRQLVAVLADAEARGLLHAPYKDRGDELYYLKRG
jgi:hypothetical protein